jgi:hypothetical protein
MLSLTNILDGLMTTVCQGSRALDAQAEKAEWSFMQSRISTNSAHPSNLVKLRLDGWNPHGYRLRQPPNLANQHAHPRTRIRARVGNVPTPALPIKLKNRLGRLGGWRSEGSCGFQPSNLLSNLFEVGMTRGKKGVGSC